MNNFCQECGAQVTAGAAFCSSCGHPLEPRAEAKAPGDSMDVVFGVEQQDLELLGKIKHAGDETRHCIVLTDRARLRDAAGDAALDLEIKMRRYLSARHTAGWSYHILDATANRFGAAPATDWQAHLRLLDNAVGHFETGTGTKVAAVMIVGDETIIPMPCFENPLKANPAVHSFDASKGIIKLKMSNNALRDKLDGKFPPEVSLILDEYVSPSIIEQALYELAKSWQEHGDIPSCLKRLILRQSPKLTGLPKDTPLKDLARTLPAMRGSTLAIQGPPGTGKTYTGSRLIKQLIESGKRIGITSNSRKAIINLIEGIHEAGGDLNGSVYATTKKDLILDTIPGLTQVASKNALDEYEGGIVAGTAWLFTRPEFAGKLDYLFIDEAGQVSLANVAAISRATDNLVLMGDQNQLPMPTQGTHPGESGLSSLVYLLREHAVVPPELGVFLETTYRLHPDICEFISESFYQGELHFDPLASKHRIALPPDPGAIDIESGILFHPVPHRGNTQASEEEVGAISEILTSLLGRTFTDRKGESRPVSLEDILFVAPYNMQVHRLEKTLPEGARIGSVDRFQGQEAPIVIVSLCSSAGEFGSRGLAFILDSNRLNVALSRAQALAIVVADPNIASTPAANVKELRLINTFCRLLHTIKSKQ